MTYGPKAGEPWVKAKIEAGDPPAFIVDWPEVEGPWRLVWEAWHELAGDRAGGLGPTPTPFMAVDRYAERYGVDDFPVFHRLIRAMDGAMIDHLNERREHDA